MRSPGSRILFAAREHSSAFSRYSLIAAPIHECFSDERTTNGLPRRSQGRRAKSIKFSGVLVSASIGWCGPDSRDRGHGCRGHARGGRSVLKSRRVVDVSCHWYGFEPGVLSSVRRITERPSNGITKARLGGFHCGLEFASMFPCGGQRFRLNPLIQPDQLSPERRQSRTAAADSTRLGFDHGKTKGIVRGR
jgi:hypothetical protein